MTDPDDIAAKTQICNWKFADKKPFISHFRLAALNEEIRASSDFAGGDDDTFNDVVQV